MKKPRYLVPIDDTVPWTILQKLPNCNQPCPTLILYLYHGWPTFEIYPAISETMPPFEVGNELDRTLGHEYLATTV
jgi:hypothetical protein